MKPLLQRFRPLLMATVAIAALFSCQVSRAQDSPTLEELQQQLAEAESNRDAVQAQLEAARANVTTIEQQLLAAELAVIDAQRAVDNYVPPPDPPDAGTPIELTVNGEPWTFRTAPSPDLCVKEHPRFLLPGREDEIRAKMTDPDWRRERNKIGDWMVFRALRYAVLGDVAAGEAAKQALLALDGSQNNPGSDWYADWLLAYDWTADLFSPEDKARLFEILVGEAGLSMPPPGGIEYEVVGVQREVEQRAGWLGWFHNDGHEPYSHSNGFQFRGLIALAFHGDGVRDEWCEHVYQVMLRNTDARIYPIYDASRGGLLDLHNALALDSGGSQMGNHGDTITGYSGMLWSSCPRLMAAWETATGDDLFSRDNLYRFAPHWVVYRDAPVGDNRSLQSMFMLTGLYRDIDPQTAGLAAWICSREGVGKYYDIWAFCLADKAVAPISPYDARLDLAGVRRGDDYCVSFGDWDTDATKIWLTIRTLDTSRYEPNVGLLRIDSRGQKLLISGQAKKGEKLNIYGSGMWIWPTGKLAPEEQQHTTYWGGNHLPGDEGRAGAPYEVATSDFFRGTTPTEVRGGADYQVFAVDSQKFWGYGDSAIDVRKCKRTVVHLQGGDREFVIVRDRVDVGPGLSHCWGGRVMNLPTVQDNRFTAVVNDAQMVGTVLSDDAIDVRGGPGKSTEGPNGESYDKSGYHFRDDDAYRWKFGSYAVFLKPRELRPQQDYTVVLEIGEAGFTPAPASVNADVVSVGGWEIDFSTEDETKVRR